MHTSWLDSATRQIATASIISYQKYLSPRKGFSCAHRLLYGGESCSEYVKRQIARKGLVAAVKTSRQRFQMCREANQILKSRYATNSDNGDENTAPEDAPAAKPKRKTSQRNPGTWDCSGCDTSADLVDCSCGLINCGSDCSHFASGLDCGGADCASGLDCGGADCGSCG